MISKITAADIPALLAAARAGNQESLGQLLEVHRPLLLALANQELAPRLRSKVGASDLVQDTLLEAFKGFSQFQGKSEAELRHWLQQIYHHNAVDNGRRYQDAAKRNVQFERPLQGDNFAAPPATLVEPMSPLAEILRLEQLEELERTLQKLSPEDRDLITLRHRVRLSFEEIARRLGCTETAVRQRWLRALARWRKALEADHATI